MSESLILALLDTCSLKIIRIHQEHLVIWVPFLILISFAAPEVMCRLNHSFGVDIFAVGVIGFEFMLGKVKFLVI